MVTTKHNFRGAEPVVGFAGYWVSPDGGVWSSRKGDAVELKTYPDRDGYPRVRLAVDGRRRQVRVHALVAAAFLPLKPSPWHVTRHLDGDPTNNDARNLSWGTPKENAADRERHGRTCRGERHHSARLRVADIPAIRKRLSAGETTASVASDFGVTDEAVRQVGTGKTWKGVPRG